MRMRVAIVLVIVTAGCGSANLPTSSLSHVAAPLRLPASRFGPFYEDKRPGGYPIGQIVLGPDENLWFADTSSIGRITPQGVQTKFAPNAAGGIIANGPSKTLWFVSYDSLGNPAISQITTHGSIKNFPIPLGVFVIALTWGADNNEWFADNGRDAVGKMTPSGRLTEYRLPDAATHLPVGITRGPDGNAWFEATAFYGGSLEVGNVTPGGKITEYPLPQSCTQTTDSIVLGADGNLWISANCSGYAMLSVTTSGATTVYPVAHPMYEMSLGFDQQLWGSFQKYITEFNTATHVQAAPIRTPIINGHQTMPWALAASARSDMWLTANTSNGTTGSGFIGVYRRR
jgi:streptogramin lyase